DGACAHGAARRPGDRERRGGVDRRGRGRGACRIRALDGRRGAPAAAAELRGVRRVLPHRPGGEAMSSPGSDATPEAGGWGGGSPPYGGRGCLRGAGPPHVVGPDVAPRDGLQNIDTPISTEAKLRLVRGLLDAGAERVEATSFVSPRWVPQLADASELLRA